MSDDDEYYMGIDFGFNQISFDFMDQMAYDSPKENDGMDGCFCKKCKEFFQYARPNQKDGTLICYSCRTPWW